MVDIWAFKNFWNSTAFNESVDLDRILTEQGTSYLGYFSLIYRKILIH